MGLISSIRKRLWIVTVLMAMALLGFILMDMNSGNSGALFKNSNNMGTVAGKSLDYTEFLCRFLWKKRISMGAVCGRGHT